MKLMKLFFRVILFTLFPLTLISQPLVIQWQQCYGGSDDDIGLSVLPSYNGFFLFGLSSSTDGQVSGNHGNTDLWLVSVDSSGNFLKSACFGGSEFDPAEQMKACPEGGYILLGGPFSTDGTVTNNHGGSDYWLIKTDREGDLQWQKCFGGSVNDMGSDLVVTSDSGFLCTGSSWSTNGDVTGNHGVYDYWVIKVDKNGNLKWENSFGGTSMDNGLGLSETNDGGMILGGNTGSFDGDVQCEHHSEIDAWVVKLDSLGDIEWERCYGGSNTESVIRILPREDGSYILLGTTDSDDGDVSGNHGGFDFWVLKIDHEGNIIWQKCFGGSYDDDPIFFKRLSDGNFIAGGLTMSNDGDVSGNHSFEGYRDMWIFKFTPQGDLLWQQCFGGTDNEYMHDVLELSDERLLIIGNTYTPNNTGDVQCTYRGFSDMWLLMVEDSTLTGVKESMESYNELKVFPNPASGSVTFSCGSKSRSGEIAIQITDQLGRMVKELILPSTGSEITWHTGTAYPGVYIYFYTIDNIKRTGKIVIMQSM